jgi:hypothetical protein
VEVGQGVVVRAPFVRVVVPPRPPMPVPLPPPVPATPPVTDGSPPPVPKEEQLLVPPGKAVPTPAARAVTPGEFVAGAKPFRPGRYDVTFVHPTTKRPVRVEFELPVSPRRVSVTGSRIDFRWGIGRGFSLYFNDDGTVQVAG